jgi:hypothetical protein
VCLRLKIRVSVVQFHPWPPIPSRTSLAGGSSGCTPSQSRPAEGDAMSEPDEPSASRFRARAQSANRISSEKTTPIGRATQGGREGLQLAKVFRVAAGFWLHAYFDFLAKALEFEYG